MMPFPNERTQPYFPAPVPVVGNGKLCVNPSAVGASGKDGRKARSESAGGDGVCSSGTRVSAARVTPGGEGSVLRQL